MIKNFTPRLYQETILATCVNYNTLVVLPTGLGKTNVFLMLAAQRLSTYPNSKILFLGPTRPLIDQYYQVFSEHFEIPEEKIAIFTGNVSPKKREELWKTSQIIFSTPQGLENDILTNRIDLRDVALLGIDEAHRAVGDYSYVFIAKQYNNLAKYPRILALTASPGSDLQKITDVCNNLFIEQIEARTDQDPDVKPYIQKVNIDWVPVELPESFKTIKKYLEDSFKSKIASAKELGYISSSQLTNYSKKELLMAQAHLQGEIARGTKDFEILKSVSLLAESLKVQHALELLETQGITALHEYIDKIMKDSIHSKVKAVQNLSKDLNFRTAWVHTKNMFEAGVEHPKLKKLKDILFEELDDDKKVIVFNHFRDSATKITEEINKLPNIRAQLFVGQAKKKSSGLSQKQQKEVLDKFRNGEFNVLVATSVAEEGLDIPSVDLVLFYEPIPSAIRTVQRRGRTGRHGEGRVMILMTQDTRDVAYKWSAHHKEKRMIRILDSLKQKFGIKNPRLTNSFAQKNNTTLQQFVKPEEDIKIFADYREKGSGVIKALVELGVKLNLEKLNVGDFLCSSRVAVEFKTVPDFIDSIIDGRLLEQAKSLKQNFERPIIIIEGEQDIYTVRNIHPNAIRGLLATLTISYGIPVIFTRNSNETASLLAIICKREQINEQKDFSLHGSKKPLSDKELQEYIVSAFPGVGATLAKPLLKQFKSIKNLVNADTKELKQVELIGDIKAKQIRDILDKEWEE